MDATKTVQIAGGIAQLAEQLERDLENAPDKKAVFHDVRKMRRSLNVLEMELRHGEDTTLGDAC